MAEGIDSVRKVEASSAETAPVGCFANHALIGTPKPTLTKALAELNGLVLWHTVRSADGQRHLITYWRSVDHFTAHEEDLAQLLPGAALTNSGLVASIGAPKSPWWARVKLSTLVLSAAALAGALEVLANEFDSGFAPPSLALKPEKLSFEGIAGEDWRTTIQVINRHLKVQHRDIGIEAFIATKSGQRRPLTVNETAFPDLGGADSKELVLEGTLPSEPGLHEIHLRVTASAGLVRPKGEFPLQLKLRVWPREPVVLLALKESGPGWAKLQARVMVGHAARAGLDCSADFAHAAGLRYTDHQIDAPIGVFGDRLVPPSPGPSPDALATLRWSTDAVEARQSVTVSMVLTGPSGLPWAELARQATAVCERRKGKPNESKS